MKLAACAIAAGLAISHDAESQQVRPATDSELRSAYCLVMLQGRLETIERLAQVFADVPEAAELIASNAASTERDIVRLRAYLLPRMGEIDALALSGAVQVAQAELAANARNSQTLSDGAETWGELSAALENAPGPSPQAQRCYNLDWLPF